MEFEGFENRLGNVVFVTCAGDVGDDLTKKIEANIAVRSLLLW